MILSNEIFTSQAATFANIPQAMRALMINSTVRLDAGVLKASGVIFNVVGNKVEILTAAHNILIYKKLILPPNDWTDAASEFAAVLTVRYNPAGTAFNGAPSAALNYNKNSPNITVAVPKIATDCENRADCYYDLAVITCVDSDLAAFAKTVLAADYDLSAAAKKATENKMFLKLKLDGATNTWHSGYMHCQLGYGKVKETRRPFSLNQQKIVVGDAVVKQSSVAANAMAEYNLQYRLTAPKADAYTCFFDQIAPKDKAPSYSEHCSAFELQADATSTSAEGDSGGPIFAIEYELLKTIDAQTKQVTRRQWTFNDVTLIGLTTGSDMETSKKLPTALFKNDIATSVLPYLKTRV